MESLSQQKEIALFGGTFDPVHQGHLDVAKNARETCSLDRVIFLPCRQSPHKENNTGASEEERLEMLRLATAELPWAEVSDWEYSQPLPSYSWRTVESLQKIYQGVRLHWLMGGDQWEVLPTWNRFEDLAKMVDIIVHTREGSNADLSTHPGTRVKFVTGDHPASSSQVRAFLAAGEGVPPQWLPASVLDFVRRAGLYQQ